MERTKSGKVKLTPEQYRKLMGEDRPSTDVRRGLTFGDPKPVERQKTAAEIKAEVRASYNADPKQRAFDERLRAVERQRIADTVELHARRMDEAFDEEDEALIVARGVEFARANPAAWQQYLESCDERVYEHADSLGLDPEFDADYPTDDEMPSVAIGKAVADVAEYNDLTEKLAASDAKLGRQEQSNRELYVARLRAAGLAPDPDDEQSVGEHLARSAWIAASTGYTPGEIAVDDPVTASDWIISADAQRQQWESSVNQAAFRKQLREVETGDVAAGLRTGEDEQKTAQRELIDEMRAARGLPPKDAPPIPTFDPEWTPPAPREEVADPQLTQTVAEFKKSVTEEEPTSFKHPDAWTTGGQPDVVGGEPSTFDEVTRDREREAEAARMPRGIGGIT